MLRSAVVLDAGMPLQGARTRLFAQPEDAHIVVRTQVGIELTFHLFRAGALLDQVRCLPATAEEPRLGDALHLRLLPQAPVAQLADLDRAALRAYHGIVLDGPAVVGVVTARPPRQEPPPAGPPPAVPPSAGAPPSGPVEPPPAAGDAPPSVPVGPAPSPGAPPPARAPGRGPWRLPIGRTRSAGATPSPDVGERPAPRKMSPPGPTRSAQPAGAAATRGGAGQALRPPVPSAGGDARPVPWQAWASVELEKDVLAPGEAFELGIGLAHEAQPDVVGGLIATVLPAGTSEVPLDITIVADGFEAPAGWHYRLVADVTDLAKTRLTIPLVAPRDHVTRLTVLEVHFAHRGVPCGVAFRRVAVQPPVREEAGMRPPASAIPWIGAATAATVNVDAAALPPDLTITISKPDGNEATGRYYWSFSSPHLLSLPDAPVPTDLGDDARTFAGRVIQLITRAEG
ncbi:MAG TPA: hypothetical protein VK929_09710, partial [Longimicrobiales bacterium]|nr:hypothetical protein [Longimicrobiales bacterium]